MKKIYFKNGDDAIYMVAGKDSKESGMLYHECQRLRTIKWIRRQRSTKVAERDKKTGETVMRELTQNGPKNLWGYPTGILFGSFLNHAPYIEEIDEKEAVMLARKYPNAN